MEEFHFNGRFEFHINCSGRRHRVLYVNKRWVFPDHDQNTGLACRIAELEPPKCIKLLNLIRHGEVTPSRLRDIGIGNLKLYRALVDWGKYVDRESRMRQIRHSITEKESYWDAFVRRLTGKPGFLTVVDGYSLTLNIAKSKRGDTVYTLSAPSGSIPFWNLFGIGVKLNGRVYVPSKLVKTRIEFEETNALQAHFDFVLPIHLLKVEDPCL